jgi:hypothetical protein
VSAFRRIGEPLMILAVADTIRAGSAAAIARIQALNVPVIMLAGDNSHTNAPATAYVAAPAPAHRRRRDCRLSGNATNSVTRRPATQRSGGSPGRRGMPPFTGSEVQWDGYGLLNITVPLHLEP